MLRNVKLLITMSILSYIFNGCSEQPEAPLPIFMKQKMPKFMVLEEISKQPIRFYKIANNLSRYEIDKKDAHLASEISLVRQSKNMFYEKYINKYIENFK